MIFGMEGRMGVGGIWGEGAGGIKSCAGGWGEALAGENGWLRMPVNVSALGFGVFYQYIV